MLTLTHRQEFALLLLLNGFQAEPGSPFMDDLQAMLKLLNQRHRTVQWVNKLCKEATAG